MTEIRKATEEDVPELVEMWNSFMEFHRELRKGEYELTGEAQENIRDRFHKYMSDEGREVFVADPEKGEPRTAGFTVCRIENTSDVFQTGKKVRITDFYVRPDFRGHNLGLRLVKRVQEWGREQGAVALFMSIDANNELGRRFWNALDFELVRETYEISL